MSTYTIAKQQILDDIASGIVPPSVSSFGELHDFVDANEYGGLMNLDADEANRVSGQLDSWLASR